MPISKYFTYAGSALLVLLFVSNAYLTDDDADLRFDGSLYESALYAPRQEEIRENGGASLSARCHACHSRQGSIRRVRPQRASPWQA